MLPFIELSDFLSAKKSSAQDWPFSLSKPSGSLLDKDYKLGLWPISHLSHYVARPGQRFICGSSSILFHLWRTSGRNYVTPLSHALGMSALSATLFSNLLKFLLTLGCSLRKMELLKLGKSWLGTFYILVPLHVNPLGCQESTIQLTIKY